MSKYSGVCDLYDQIYMIGRKVGQSDKDCFIEFFYETGGVIHANDGENINFEYEHELVPYWDYEIASMARQAGVHSGTNIWLAKESVHERRLRDNPENEYALRHKEELYQEYLRLKDQVETGPSNLDLVHIKDLVRVINSKTIEVKQLCEKFNLDFDEVMNQTVRV